jgi:hypothetical protein
MSAYRLGERVWIMEEWGPTVVWEFGEVQLDSEGKRSQIVLYNRGHIATGRWFSDRELWYACGKTLALEQTGSSRICPKRHYFGFPNTTNRIIVNRDIIDSNLEAPNLRVVPNPSWSIDQVHYAYQHNVVSDRPDAVIKGIASWGPQTVTPGSATYDPKNTNRKSTVSQNEPHHSKSLVNIVVLSHIAQALLAIPTRRWSHLTVILDALAQP